jgi:serine/threonine protein kinase
MNQDAFPSHSALGQGAPWSSTLPFIGPPAQPGQIGTLDGWELVSLIGEGGMGLVFLGRTSLSGQEVAIKVLRPEFSQSDRAKSLLMPARGFRPDQRRTIGRPGEYFAAD